jgi:hypothetical protein
MEIDRRPAERRALAWVVGAAVLGAALGLGVLSFVRSHRRSRAAAERLAVTVAHVAPVETQAPPTIELDAVPTTVVAPAGADPRSGRVRLHVQPSTASIVVDGVLLAAGQDTIARPIDGGTATVLVRAEKHDDTIVLVDSATPDALDIALVPATAPGPRRRTASSAPEAGASPAATPSAPEAPPNPYE